VEERRGVGGGEGAGEIDVAARRILLGGVHLG
jgi:hypothetical protein